MINFKRFRIENAIHFGCDTLNLEKQGLVLIQGINGCGKSSTWNLLQALFYGGYYVTPKAMAKKNDLLSASGKDLLLECEFEKDGHNFIIRQTRNHTDYGTAIQVYKDGNFQVNLAKHNMVDAQDDLQNFLGLSLDEFLGYVYLTQGSSHKLMEGTAGERTKYLASLRQLDLYDEVCKELKEKLKSLELEAVEIDKYAESIKTLEKQLLGYKPREYYETAEKALSDEVCDLNEEAESIGRRVEHATDMVSKLKQRIKLMEKIGNYTEEETTKNLVKIKESVLAAKEFITANAPKVHKWESMLKNKKEYDVLKPKLENAKSSQDIEKAIKNLQNNLVELSQTIPDLERKKRLTEELAGIQTPEASMSFDLRSLDQAKDIKAANTSDIKRIEKELSNYKELKVGDCDRCGSKLTAEHIQNKIATLSLELNKKKNEIVAAEFDIKKLSKILEVHQKISSLSEQLASITSDGNLDEIKEDAKLLKTKIERTSALLKEVQRFESLKELLVGCPENLEFELQAEKVAILGYEAIIEAGSNTIPQLNAILEAFGQIKDLPEGDIEEWQARLGKMSEESKTLMKKLADASTDLGRITSELKGRTSLEKEIENLQTKIKNKAAVERQIREVVVLIKAYGPKGLKVSKLKSLCNDMNKVLPKYANLIFGGKERFRFAVNESSGEVDFDFTLDHNNWYDVKFMSGGQKKRLSMCMVFVLADLVIPSKRANVIILDEVDGPLDEIGKYTLANEFLPNLKSKYESIFVISHSSALNGIVCDNRLTYSKDENGKTVITRG